MVMNPVTTHARIRSAGDSTSRAISAETMKMPEPIIEPITREVALVRLIPLTNSVDSRTGTGIWVGVVRPDSLTSFSAEGPRSFCAIGQQDRYLQRRILPPLRCLGGRFPA